MLLEARDETKTREAAEEVSRAGRDVRPRVLDVDGEASVERLVGGI